VVGALGITEGCVHLEFFETAEGELVFLEIANRVGGAGIVEAYERHTGVHLPTHEIAVRLGRPRPLPKAASGRFHGFALFPGHGFATDRPWTATVPDALRRDPRVDAVHLLDPRDRPTGDGGHITYQQWQVPVFVEASHRDCDALAEFLVDCVRTITVEADPADRIEPARVEVPS
jgi:hypothetical protein